MMSPLELLLTSLVTAGFGAFLGAYLQQKGRNLATREDLDKVVRVTEEIRAQVSGALWLEQTRWNSRREVYTKLLEHLGELRELLRKERVWRELRPVIRPDDTRDREHTAALSAKQAEILAEVRRAASTARIVLDAEGAKAVEQWEDEWASARDGWLRDGELTGQEQLPGWIAAVERPRDSLIAIARKDLFSAK